MTTTEYRLEIEGLGAQPVTSPLLEQTLVDGRVRLRGLERDGLGFSERVDPVRAESEMGGFTATVIEQPGEMWTQHFAKRPSLTTYLQSDVAAVGAETLTLLSTAGLSALDVIHIGTEAMLIQTVVDATDIVVGAAGRGYWGTISQAHYTEDGARLVRPAVTSEPTSLERRRAYLYRYDLGAGDDPQGDGTLVMRGICVTDASLGGGGTVWSLTVDPLTTVLDVDLGSDIEDPTRPRGYDFTGSGAMEATVVWGTSSATMVFADFYETPDDFAESFGLWVSESIAGATVSSSIRDGQLRVRVESADSISIRIGTEAMTVEDGAAAGLGAQQVFVSSGWGDSRGSVYQAGDRLYLEQMPALIAGDLCYIHTTDPAAFVNGRGLERQRIAEANNAEGYVVFANQITTSPFQWSTSTGIEVTFAKSYKRFGSLADFRDALVAQSPELANKQGFPLVTTGDLADWTSVVDASAVDLWQTLRTYVAVTEVSLLELLTQECRLVNVFPALDASGALTLRRLVLPTLVTPTTFALDASTILADDEPVSWERQAMGTIGIITLRTGYDATEDDYTGPTVRLRDARSPSPQELLIEPKSQDEGTLSRDAAVGILRDKLAFYARPYMVITCQVPHTLLADALVGSFCTVTNHRIPNPSTGSRGVDGAVGLVVGRSWDFSTDVGTLDIMLTFDDLSGYAPEVTIGGATGSGTDWDLELSDDDPLELTELKDIFAEDIFAAGDAVEAFASDTGSPTYATGTVTAVAGDLVSVAFDAAWTPPASAMLRPQSYGTAGANLEAYFFAADAAATLGSDPARVLA